MYRSADPATGRRAPLAWCERRRSTVVRPRKASSCSGSWLVRQRRSARRRSRWRSAGRVGMRRRRRTDERCPAAPHPASTLHADLVERQGPSRHRRRDRRPATAGGSDEEPRPRAQGDLPRLRRRQDAAAGDQLQRLQRRGAQVRVHASARRCSTASSRCRPISTAGTPTSTSSSRSPGRRAAASTPRWSPRAAAPGAASTASVAGVAPFLCQDLHGGVAYTLDGGANAHDTAVIIAQEQAHLLGPRARLRHQRHHVPVHLPGVRRVRESGGDDQRRPLRSADPELVPDDDGRARPLGRRAQAVGVRLHQRQRAAGGELPLAQATASGWATTSR